MASSVVIVQDADQEPITLDEAKGHLRVTSKDDEPVIKSCIRAARQYAEMFLNRCLVTSQLRYNLDSFPDLPNATLKFFVPTYSVESYLARAISLMSGPIYLPRPHVLSVQSVKYLDASGVLQTLAANPAPGLPGYILDLDAEPARLAPANNLPWPITLAQQNAVTILLTCGYGESPDLIPETTKMAIKLLISHFYENREPVSDKMATSIPLVSVEALLWCDRVYEIP
jgi:Phage gp6-like head-tail connector protein